MSYRIEYPRTLHFADELKLGCSARVPRVSDPLCGSDSFLLAVICAGDEVERIDPPADCVTCRICM